MLTSRKHTTSGSTFSGFTLVELLIATMILIILTTLSVAVYTTTSSADRIRSSARQVQSAFSGARDRAIKMKQPVGLRLLLDPVDPLGQAPRTVSSFVYVGASENWKQGLVQVGRPGPDANGLATVDEVKILRGYYTGWKQLFDQGLLVDGARVRIPRGAGGSWYTVSTSQLAGYTGTGPEILVLNSFYRISTAQIPYSPAPTVPKGADAKPGRANYDDDGDGTQDNPEEIGWPSTCSAFTDDSTNIHAFSPNFVDTNGNQCFDPGLDEGDYELELKPGVLPGQEPLRLSKGIAIHLFASVLPAAWLSSQRSLPRSSPLPPTDKGWNGSSYVYNGWGGWSIEGPDPDPMLPNNDIYRQYSPRMDVLFSPRGYVSGPLAATGLIHLRQAELEDIAQRRLPSDDLAGTMLYSTLFPQTGYVATFPVDTTGDPLKFARIGGTVGR